jgi:hypothetical protein
MVAAGSAPQHHRSSRQDDSKVFGFAPLEQKQGSLHPKSRQLRPTASASSTSVDKNNTDNRRLSSHATKPVTVFERLYKSNKSIAPSPSLPDISERVSTAPLLSKSRKPHGSGKVSNFNRNNARGSALQIGGHVNSTDCSQKDSKANNHVTVIVHERSALPVSTSDRHLTRHARPSDMRNQSGSDSRQDKVSPSDDYDHDDVLSPWGIDGHFGVTGCGRDGMPQAKPFPRPVDVISQPMAPWPSPQDLSEFAEHVRKLQDANAALETEMKGLKDTHKRSLDDANIHAMHLVRQIEELQDHFEAPQDQDTDLVDEFSRIYDEVRHWARDFCGDCRGDGKAAANVFRNCFDDIYTNMAPMMSQGDLHDSLGPEKSSRRRDLVEGWVCLYLAWLLPNEWRAPLPLVRSFVNEEPLNSTTHDDASVNLPIAPGWADVQQAMNLILGKFVASGRANCT